MNLESQESFNQAKNLAYEKNKSKSSEVQSYLWSYQTSTASLQRENLPDRSSKNQKGNMDIIDEETVFDDRQSADEILKEGIVDQFGSKSLDFKQEFQIFTGLLYE